MRDPVSINQLGFGYVFSVCTLVTDWGEYNEMLNTFNKTGFGEETEFLYIDNSTKNQFDAYQGINEFLSKSRGQYIIICHQDILMIDSKNELLRHIEEISEIDKKWAILGNAGGVRVKSYSKYIKNGNNNLEEVGIQPAKVRSLDENFLVFNKKANPGLSTNLSGFHFYGTEACLLSEIRGYSCYTIQFLVKHKSSGNVNTQFFLEKHLFISAYNRKLKWRFIQTPCTRLFISSSRCLNYLVNSRVGMFIAKEYYKGVNFFT
jgi:hypothetical protein